MRNVGKVVIAVVIVMSLSVPAQAAPRNGGRWFERTFDPIVKVIKKFVFKSLGDGLTDPRP